MKAFEKNSSHPPYPFLFNEEKKKKSFEKITERLMLQAGNWEIIPMYYFPAVFY